MSAMAGASASGPLPAAWRGALGALLLLVAAVLLIYRETLSVMVGIWARSDTFAHAFLVPPIVLWLIWRQRHVVATIAPRPAYTAMALMALIGLGWLLGDLAVVNAVSQLSLVALLVLAVPAVLGWRVARALAFPLGFLFFAVPLGEFLLPIFMLWTADFTVFALRLSGIPVYREGLQFVIPSGNWSVVEACSGVRYLIASVVVGTLYAYLNYRSLSRRLIFVGVALLVPIVANWVRAYLIVMVGHLSDNRIAAGADHLIYGWVFFGVVIGLMFWIGARWREDSAPLARTAVARAAQGVASRPAASAALWLAALAGLAVAWWPQAARQAVERIEGARGQPRMVSLQLPGWQAGAPALADWRPGFEGAAAEYATVMAGGEQRVGLYVGYYRKQEQGRKLISSTNSLLPASNKQWSAVSQSLRSVPAGDQSLDVREVLLRASRVPGRSAVAHLRAWQVYWVDGRLTTSDYVAKALTVLSRLRGNGDDGAVLIFYALEAEPGQADAPLRAFVSDAMPVLQPLLLRMSDGSFADVAQRP
jgi:exosortase A